MSGEQYSNNLLEAMSIIADRAVATANYDKTVQATIVECRDATIGKYKVRYQDGFWQAYENNTNITYTPGTSVYILIPNGDMSQHKTILGTVKKLGINYINTIEEEDRYAENGNNMLFMESQSFQLHSYQTQTIRIYDIDRTKNDIKIDIAAASAYLKTSSHLKCSFTIQTSLDFSQRYNGNYGIKFYLDFEDKSLGEIVTRQYIFDTYLMEGNPYLFNNKVKQNSVFEIDGENFVQISRIELFTQLFPQKDETKEPDIFISNLSIIGVNQLSQEEINSVSLSFVAKKGYIFNKNSEEDDERTIQAIVRVLGKTVPNNSQGLRFYWFVRNVSVSTQSPYYTKYGGIGWKCLNTYSVLSQTEDQLRPLTVNFNPSGPLFTIKKSDVRIKQQQYKCVVLYGDNTFEKQFKVINNDADYEISLQSDSGTQFVLDAGYPTLTCSVKQKDKQGQYKDVTDNFSYRWGVINNKGVFSVLEEINNVEWTRMENEKSVFNEIDNNFKSNMLLKNGTDYVYRQGLDLESVFTNQDVYNVLKERLQYYKIKQYIYKNILHNVNIKKIVNFSTYVCTVIDSQSNVIGSKEITLVNKATSNGGYTLVINNSKQVFNYNEQGVSPCDNEKINFVIPELSFSLYNQKGVEIDQKQIRQENIRWIFPNKEDSLLNDYLMQDKEKIPQTNGTTIYPNTRIFSYGISKKYFVNKNSNDIQLQVIYNGYTLSARTNFIFTKEGFAGTNGTGLVLRIVPIDEQGNQINELPCFKVKNNITTQNFNLLKAELWENGEQIINEESFYLWSILKNASEKTNLVLGNKINNTLKVSYSPLPPSTEDDNETPVNIIKLSVQYNGRKVYATIPILVYQFYQIPNNNYNSQFNLYLKPNTGFQYVFYAEDGTSPQYDDREPFTFILTETSIRTNNNEQDISDIDLQEFEHVYNYTVNGNISIKDTQNISKQCVVIPDSTYDGSILNNTLICEVSYLNNVIAKCTVPIHMMLNRYGHAALNDWDGNSIDIGNTSGDTILAPQVGAGQKNNQNQFTGILMGTVKNGNGNKQNGLFGYSNGDRTIFLDAETGDANFGIAGNGQIKINAIKSTITGGGYDNVKSQTGMLIDLKTPKIKFKTGNFSVDENGFLVAKGGGSIAGWNIENSKLSKDTVGMSSDNSSNSNIAFWAGNTKSSDAPFSVNFKGDLKATSMNIGGDVFIDKGKIYSKDHPSFTSTGSGFYLSSDGLSLGANFSVNKAGSLVAKDGYIGNGSNGFKINPTSISNGNVYLGTDKISLGSTFSVNNTGFLTASKGKIAGWNFNNKAIYNDDVTDPRYGNSAGVFSKGVYFGEGGLRMGANFHVGSNGWMYATAGTIGGWTIGSSTLKGGNLTLNSGGSMSGPGWKIESGGKATFNNIHITGGEMSGGTISGGNRTGGSITGGSISPGGVGCGGYDNMNKWCEHIVATSVTADYIESKVSDSGLSFTGWLNARKFSCSKEAYYKGSQIATRSWVQTELLKYAKKSDIPSSANP